MRLPTSTGVPPVPYVHFLSKPTCSSWFPSSLANPSFSSTGSYTNNLPTRTYSRSCPFTRASLFFSSSGSFTSHPSHRYFMEVCTADVVHCKGSLAFRFFLSVRDEQREKCFHTFQTWHTAEEFSCRTNVGFLHGLLDLSANRDLKCGRPASPLSASIQRRDTAVTPSASMSILKGWVPKRACLTLSVSSTAPRMSSTKASSAKHQLRMRPRPRVLHGEIQHLPNHGPVRR